MNTNRRIKLAKHYTLSMKVLTILALVLSSISYPILAQERTSLTLEECIEYALGNNENIKNAKYEREIAKAQVGETRSAALPQISGIGELSHNPIIQRAFLPGIFFDEDAGEEDFFAARFGTDFSGNASISATQMIFDGSVFVGLRAAKTYQELSRKDQIKTEIDVVEAVTKAYYMVMVTMERQKLVGDNFARLDTLLKETNIMFENGFAEKIDVDRIRVQYNNVKIERQNVVRDLEVSYYLLKFQMGMNIYEPIALANDITDINLNFDLAPVDDFDYPDRIEYSQMMTNRELAGYDLKNNQIQYFPKLSVFANGGAVMGANEFNQAFNFSDSWFPFATYGARIEIPIFDGLLKSHRIQANRVQIAQTENQMNMLKNSINLEVEQSSTRLKNNIELLNAQQENRDLAGEVFEVSKIKYQEGVGSNIEVIDAEIAFKEAETNYYNALYEVLVAKVEREKALGILLKK